MTMRSAMPDEQVTMRRRQNLIEACHRRRQVVGDVMEVGTRRKQGTAGLAPHERVPNDRVTRVEDHRDRSGGVARGVDHRSRHAKGVETHAVDSRNVGCHRGEGEVPEESGEQLAAESDPPERTVVAAVDQGLVGRVVRDRTASAASQGTRVSEMIGMDMGAQDERQVADIDCSRSQPGLDPLQVPTGTGIDEDRSTADDEIGVGVSQPLLVDDAHSLGPPGRRPLGFPTRRLRHASGRRPVPSGRIHPLAGSRLRTEPSMQPAMRR